MTNRRFSITAGVLLAATALTGCSMAYDGSTVEPIVSADPASSEATLDTLRWADEIVLKKEVFSVNDRYSVTADGEELGEITGQYIYALGDTFSFFNSDGNLVASEGEGYRVTTHKAETFDYNNEKLGEIREDISFLMAKWSLYDLEGQKTGTAEQNFSWTLKFQVKNAAGEPEYLIEKSAFTIGAELTVTRLRNEPQVAAMDAVWLAAIANEIEEASEEK